MCIALISTAHPSYSLILIDNRDEYVHRPTAPAAWWPEPHADVLAGRDLARAIQGTWMGITRDGKVAVLTNYREKKTDQAQGVQSRGAIVSSWLAGAGTPPTREFVEKMVASPTARDVGGFSLVCGYVDEPLAVVSNRSSTMDSISWLATQTGQTVGLSNTTFDDRSWPKILDGERLIDEAIAAHARAAEDEDEDALIDRLLAVLNRNTLPRLADDATAEDYLPYFRKSIFIPLLGLKEKPPPSANGVPAAGVDGQSAAPDQKSDPLDQSYLHGAYGTQQQTVILVSKSGRVRYFERTLYTDDAEAIPIGEGDRSYEFQVTRS